MPSPTDRPRVHFIPESLDDVDYSAFADTALAIAAERQAAAAKVRSAVLAALERGDVAGARALVERWTVEPLEEIAEGL